MGKEEDEGKGWKELSWGRNGLRKWKRVKQNEKKWVKR